LRHFDEKALRAIARALDAGVTEWLLGAEDAIDFLKDNAQRDEFVLYANAGAVLIHGVLAPNDQVSPADEGDLLRSMIMPDDSWCIQKAWGGGEGHRIYLEPPLSHPGCNSLVGGEKLIFRRPFIGVVDGPAPVELSQKLCIAWACIGSTSAVPIVASISRVTSKTSSV
jgi:hypothetical protein